MLYLVVMMAAATTTGKVVTLTTPGGHPLELVESSAAEQACVDAVGRQLAKKLELAQKNIEPDPGTALWRAVHDSPEACTESVVAKLTTGTRVEVLPRTPECGKGYSSVKVLSGKSVGKTGCLWDKFTKPPAPEPRPTPEK